MARTPSRVIAFTEGMPYVGMTVWAAEDGKVTMALTVPYIDAIHIVELKEDGSWDPKPTVLRGDLNGPCRLARLPSGNLLVAEHSGMRLQEMTMEGTAVRFIPTDGCMFAVAVDVPGMTVLAGKRDEDTATDRLVTYDLSTGEVTGSALPFGPDRGQAQDIMGVALMPDGHVAVATKPNRLIVLDSCGEFVTEMVVPDPGVHFVDVVCNGDTVVTTTHLCKTVTWLRLGTDASGARVFEVLSTAPLDESVVAISVLGETTYVLTTKNLLVFE